MSVLCLRVSVHAGCVCAGETVPCGCGRQSRSRDVPLRRGRRPYTDEEAATTAASIPNRGPIVLVDKRPPPGRQDHEERLLSCSKNTAFLLSLKAAGRLGGSGGGGGPRDGERVMAPHIVEAFERYGCVPDGILIAVLTLPRCQLAPWLCKLQRLRGPFSSPLQTLTHTQDTRTHAHLRPPVRPFASPSHPRLALMLVPCVPSSCGQVLCRIAPPPSPSPLTPLALALGPGPRPWPSGRFYVFEGAIGPVELAELQADIHGGLGRALFVIRCLSDVISPPCTVIRRCFSDVISPPCTVIRCLSDAVSPPCTVTIRCLSDAVSPPFTAFLQELLAHARLLSL